jgi:COP9 signalosome complex subunit 7
MYSPILILTQDIPYSTLMQALDITTTRALEDLCINTIYASLLTGKLSPHTQTFQITSCTSRDVIPTTIDYEGMITTLSQWSKQCDLVLAEISGRIRDVRTEVANKKAVEEEYERQLEEKKAATGKKGKKTAGGDAEEMMDLEGDEGFVGSPPPRSERTGGESPKARKRKLVSLLR